MRFSERSDSLRPTHQLQHREKSEQLNRLKAAILKGVDPGLFVEELNQLQSRLQILEEALSSTDVPLRSWPVFCGLIWERFTAAR